jgi:hypothetical protein
LLLLTKVSADGLRHFAELLAPALGWDEDRVAQEVEACRA